MLLGFAACIPAPMVSEPAPAPVPAPVTTPVTAEVVETDAAVPVPPDAEPPAVVAAIDLTDHPPCTTTTELRDVDDATWGPVLRDLARHIEHDGPWLKDELSTAAHESTHLMNTQITRAAFGSASWGQGRVNGFYMLQDCAVIIPEPAVRKSDVATYVPSSMRGLRYDQYVTGQESWDDVPTYIFDEWIAYTNGSAAALELRSMGNWGDRHQDALAGQIEFTIYGLALGMAVRDLDPTYFATQPAFAQLLAWNALRSLDQYRAGKDDPGFPSEEMHRLYAELRAGADGQAMRDFLSATYGVAFTAKLLDLDP